MIFCSFFFQKKKDLHHSGVEILKQTVGWNNLPTLSDARAIPVRHYISALKIHTHCSLDLQAEALDLTV